MGSPQDDSSLAVWLYDASDASNHADASFQDDSVRQHVYVVWVPSRTPFDRTAVQ